jgi:hypothetical protein
MVVLFSLVKLSLLLPFPLLIKWSPYWSNFAWGHHMLVYVRTVTRNLKLPCIVWCMEMRWLLMCLIGLTHHQLATDFWTKRDLNLRVCANASSGVTLKHDIILWADMHVRGCIQKLPDWVIMKYMLTTINTRWEATQRVVAVKVTRLTHKIVIQLHPVQRALPFAALTPGSQSGNFWIHPYMSIFHSNQLCQCPQQLLMSKSTELNTGC